MKTTVVYDGENGNVLATIGEYGATRFLLRLRSDLRLA